jgi:hypothetical protein
MSQPSLQPRSCVVCQQHDDDDDGSSIVTMKGKCEREDEREFGFIPALLSFYYMWMMFHCRFMGVGKGAVTTLCCVQCLAERDVGQRALFPSLCTVSHIQRVKYIHQRNQLAFHFPILSPTLLYLATTAHQAALIRLEPPALSTRDSSLTIT